jgi:hypothetical protein
MADGLEPDRRAQHEDAAVPEVPAAGDIGLCRRCIRLLAEGQQVHGGAARRIASADFCLHVTVTCFRAVGQDAEGHHRTGFRLGQAAQHRGAEGSDIAHVVVRRRRQQHRVGAIANGVERGSCQGRCCIAADRLQQQGPVRQAEQAQLLGGDEAIFLVADDNRRAERRVGIGRRHVAVLQRQEVLLRGGAERSSIAAMKAISSTGSWLPMLNTR